MLKPSHSVTTQPEKCREQTFHQFTLTSFLKRSHVNLKIGNVWNGPNQLLLLKLNLKQLKTILTYIYGQTPGDGEGQEAWHVTVLEVAKNHTWLGDWTLPPPPSCTPTTSCSSHVHLSAQGEQRKQKSCEVRLQRRWYQDLLSQRKQGSSHFVAFPSLPPMTSCQEPEKPHWSVHVVPSWWSQT